MKEINWLDTSIPILTNIDSYNLSGSTLEFETDIIMGSEILFKFFELKDKTLAFQLLSTTDDWVEIEEKIQWVISRIIITTNKNDDGCYIHIEFKSGYDFI